MPKTPEELRLSRLVKRTRELRSWIDRAWIALDGWTFNGEPIALGAPWPERAGVAMFEHGTITVPADWSLDDARLVLDLGGEGLVRLRGGDGCEAFGLDPRHRRLPLRYCTFSVEAEVVPRLPFGKPSRDPRLEVAHLVLTDPPVERLARMLHLIAETIRALPDHLAVPMLLEGAERVLNTIQWPSDTETYLSRVAGTSQMQSIWELPSNLDDHPPGLSEEERASVIAALARLDKDMKWYSQLFPGTGMVELTGHAHLDLAWLWPLEETRRKARRTFSTIVGLIDRYPEFHFNQSSAQIYSFVEEDDPELFNLVQERVKHDAWEPIGGMWVEPDVNMPSGEALTRQLLYGQRYFRQKFGKTHTVCWLPDCFGFTPALPQLLRGAGIENFFTIKLTWSETNRFPYDIFWWEGLDGSRVLAHMFNNPGDVETDTGGYNADTGPWPLVQTWSRFSGRSDFGQTLLSVGYGDGGGGVTAEMLEQTRALNEFPALPASHFVPVHQFFEEMRTVIAEQGITLPVWVGELYLELHRGTLTTQGRTKYLHRRAERDLAAAETLSSLAHMLGAPEPDSLEPLWRIVLRNEFHDILPGSSIREVYETAEAELAEVVEEAGRIARGALATLAERLVPAGDQEAIFVANPDLSPRPLRVESTQPVAGGQPVDGGHLLTAAVEVPGLGVAVTLATEPADPATAAARTLENRFLRVTLSGDGTVASIHDRINNREVLAGRGNQLWAYVDKPPDWDAWDIDAGYAQAGEELATAESIEVVEAGPHRGAIRVIRRFRQSTVTQDIRLWANSPRLEFRTTLDWHDRRWLLKARFPLAVRAGYATFETAFGVIERPTHRNTSWDAARFEVAGHRFADLSEAGYGVALLNDGKYGHHAMGNELGLSLLRSPAYPDPLADEGVQTFTYALLPHAGSWAESDVLMEAEDLNRPLLARRVSASSALMRSLVEVGGLQLGLGALKVAEDGGSLVFRAYEPRGSRGEATVVLPEGWQVDADLDLLESPIGEGEFSFTPFQVRSWRLRKEYSPLPTSG